MASDLAPFTYPPTVEPRRHGPDGYTAYRSYRPWLRDEFAFRCVFCLLRERRMVGLTPEADRAIRLLWLDTPQSNAWRRMWIRTVQLAEEHDELLFRQLMGYPDDLPDLTRLAAPSNSKPDGIEQSYHARRGRGELPETYLY